MEQNEVLKALQRDHAAELKLAAERLKGTARHTAIIPSKVLSDMTGHEILLKPENLQVTGSFKIRGAYNKIAAGSRHCHRFRGQPCAGRGLCGSRTWCEGNDLHAADHSAAEG